MQTERVTFLTTPEHKAALDAFAHRAGLSVGHVVREASVRYISREHDSEAELDALVDQVNAAVPQMRDDLAAMRQSIAEARAVIAQYRAEKGTSV